MGTYATINAEIAVDLTRSDLTTQIAQATLDAIEYYSAERFWFNETRGATFPTIDGTSDYIVASSIFPADPTISDFITIDYVQFAQSSTNKWMLDRICPEEMEELLVGAPEGQPTCYCYQDLTFRLYPIPDAVYTVRVAGHYRMQALTGSNSNAWTNAARNLIRARARLYLYARNIKDVDMAKVRFAQADEQSELQRLREETSKRITPSGRIKPWW